MTAHSNGTSRAPGWSPAQAGAALDAAKGAPTPAGKPSAAPAQSPDRVGAFCAHARVHVDGAPAGRLADLTFAVKDLFAVEGVTACCGNPTWLATHEPASRTAPAVRRLLDAGATLVGVTVTDELALSLTGENRHYGTPLNTRAPARVPGGSSSGSAAAVAAGLADFALGTDTGGSVRVPASHCGILGFRPSHDAVSTDGVCPLAPRFDTVGWFARDAEVLARVGDVLLDPRAAGMPRPGLAAPVGQATDHSGEDSAPPGRIPSRLFLPEEAEILMDAPAFAAFARAAGTLARRLGRPLEPIALCSGTPAIASWLGIYLALQNGQAAAIHRPWIESAQPVFGSLIARRFARALTVTADETTRADEQRALIVARVTSVLAADAWLVWPSAVGAAPLRGSSDDAIDGVTGRALALSALASLVGLPQISLPLAETDGCPLGVSLVGPSGADRALLGAAITASATDDPHLEVSS